MNISALYKRYAQAIPGIKSYVLASIFLFILGIVITTLAWYVERQRVDAQKNRQLTEQAFSLESSITNRLDAYAQILRGASGLFSASDLVTKDDWRRYIQEYNLSTTYPGINSVTYIQVVPAALLPGFIESGRAQITPTFIVYPEGSRDVYAPVTYVEPLNKATESTLGFDILTDPSRSKLAGKVRDSGAVGVSEKLTLLSDRGTANDSSFNMYTALYKKDTKPRTVDERRQNLAGYIVAASRAQDFFDQVIDKSTFTAYTDVQVFDGTTTDPGALLYRSENFKNLDQNHLSQTFISKVFDRTWTFQFAGPINNNSEDSQRATMILIGGATISVAIAGFLFLIMLTRARAIVYSKQYETQQAKDDLLSLASHQLRTPATAVKQYLGMILEGYTGKVDKKQLPALQKAYASNERQLDTINQILYVAKADAGRLSISRHLFDLNMLVDDIVLDLSDTLEENDQSIVFERSRRKIKVNADESSIRMVVENLISNAGKYSYEGGQIVVKTGIRGEEVFVSVTDRGVGIAPEDFDKLFKKFSRIDNDLSLQVGGSGIGLYVDKMLIALHGGRIDVISEPGVGSTFTIYLPRNGANNHTVKGK